MEDSLRGYAREIGMDTANINARLLHLSWKKTNRKPEHRSKKNWFACRKRISVEPGKDSLKLKLKHMGPGRTGKQEKREYYEVIGIKTDKDAVPKYHFHHIEIQKNILSPNTMLNFVPHLRDLADHEEPRYRKWLENLEDMDKESGFATLSRQAKVHKTCQKERATTLLLYLDIWLGRLFMENCTKTTLIRYMATQTDAVTPQQMSSILHSYSDETGSPRSPKAMRMFTETFDRVFNDDKIWREGAVTLGDVLLLDRSIDSIVDSKKWLKVTPNQTKPVTVENFLETYALLGCLICGNSSCDHGEYGSDNERKRFSIETVGGMSSLIHNKAAKCAAADKGTSGFQQVRKPCSEDCFLNGRPGTRARGWSETEIMLLKTAVSLLNDLHELVQCVAAVFTGRPCWDVNRQLEKMDLHIPLPLTSSSYPTAVVEVKPVHWYDRFKKVLQADWPEHTITHEHQKKDRTDPCNHEGPCTKENCVCVRHGLMCERFCPCTVETCATKFTGCSCHSQGRPCLPRQRGESKCICIQLNRECDPILCGTCGATERANPRNADDDQLFMHGCQNCALQRGKYKSVVLGQSTIEGCGYGLFAAEDIAQDDFVIEYVGEIISQDEGVRREARRGDVFDEEHNSSYLFTLLEQEGLWVDAAIYGNLSRYINHQDDFGKGQRCNIMPKILYVGGEYRIKFSALRDIDAGEELFFNYGENFPNLTKKLLDEQTEKEKKAKKQGGRKSKKGEQQDNTNPFAKPKGKRRGRKPKKKSFAAVLESDPEDEDPKETEHADYFFSRRKRKRNAVESDLDERDYCPRARPAAPHSRFPGEQRGGSNDVAQKTKEGVKHGAFGRLGRNRSQSIAYDDMDIETNTLEQQSKRSTVLGPDSDEDEDEVDEDDIDEDLDAEYQVPSQDSRRRSRGNNATTSKDDSPSRMIRERRRKVQQDRNLGASATSRKALDPADVDWSKVSARIQPLRSQKKKRGRPRKIRVVDEIAETDDNADETSVGNTSAGNEISQSITNDSDASNANANRSRVRKRPARYDE